MKLVKNYFLLRICRVIPGLAPSRNSRGRPLYRRKYWMCAISWCKVIKSFIVTFVQTLILNMNGNILKSFAL